MPLVVVLDIIFSIQNQSRPDITVTLSDLSPCPISGMRHTYSEKCWVLAHNEHVQIDWPPTSLPLALSVWRWNIFPILHGAYFRTKFRETSSSASDRFPCPPAACACSPMILIASQSGYSCCFLYPKSSSEPSHTGFLWLIVEICSVLSLPSLAWAS